MTIDASVSKRILMLRTILIAFVVFLHVGTPELKALDYNDTIVLVRFFFQDELGRLSVPTLTMISGYLLFSSKLYLTPLQLYKKKARTLLIPFFFFNIVYFAVQYAIEYSTGWAPLYPLVGKPDLVNLNYIFNYNGIALNAALHFLRDLFVLVLLAPLFACFMRHFPMIGLLLVSAVFMSDADGHLVNRNTMAVLFYVGGLAATRNWNVKRCDHLAMPALALLLAVCVGTIYFHAETYDYIYLVAPLSVWPASSLLLNTAIGNWAEKYSKYSFFLFLIHTPLIHVAEILFAHSKVLPADYGIATVMFLIGFTPLAYQAAMHVMPDTFSFLIGGRAGKSRPANAMEPVGAALAKG